MFESERHQAGEMSARACASIKSLVTSPMASCMDIRIHSIDSCRLSKLRDQAFPRSDILEFPS